MVWFQKNNLKVIDIASQGAYTIIKVEDKSSVQHFYCIVNDTATRALDTYLHGYQKEIIKNYLYKLDGMDASKICSFSCG